MAGSQALSCRNKWEGAAAVAGEDDTSGAPLKSSQFKGVHWDKTKSKWVGYIHVHGKKHHLGYFAQEEDAARAYDRESLRCRGVTKNFPSAEYDLSELSKEAEPRKALEKSSRYIGVSWNKLRRKWAARIIVDGRSLHLGHYVQEADAARAYDKVCLKSRGTTKNFPTEEYTTYSAVRRPQFSPGHATVGAVGTKYAPPHHQGPHSTYPLGAGGGYTRGEVGERSSSPEQHSQDSSTSTKALHDLQPRLFMNSRELGSIGSTGSESFGFMHSGAAPVAQPGFNPYNPAFSPTKSSVASAQSWSQPSLTGGAPNQLMNYSAGLTSLLPLGPVPHSQHSQLTGSNPFFFPQSTNQGTALHAISTPYSALPPMAPSSLLGGQPLQLPSMLPMHAGNPAATGQLPHGSHQLPPPSGMAQLQAWAALQNSMYGVPSSGLFSAEKQMDGSPPLKRPRFDTFVQ